MKLKRFNFTVNLLRQDGLTPRMMGAMFEALPQDFSIVNWGNDPSMHCCYWVIQSKEFKEVPLGQIIPEGTLEFTKDGEYLRCKLL